MSGKKHIAVEVTQQIIINELEISYFALVPFWFVQFINAQVHCTG